MYAEAVARISAACGSTSTAYMTQLHCAHPIHLRGRPEQQEQRWIPALCSADAIGAIALTETGAGSDVASMRTTARRHDDTYVIHGGKTFISNGDVADVIVLFATLDPRARQRGHHRLPDRDGAAAGLLRWHPHEEAWTEGSIDRQAQLR